MMAVANPLQQIHLSMEQNSHVVEWIYLFLGTQLQSQ